MQAGQLYIKCYWRQQAITMMAESGVGDVAKTSYCIKYFLEPINRFKMINYSHLQTVNMGCARLIHGGAPEAHCMSVLLQIHLWMSNKVPLVFLELIF